MQYKVRTYKTGSACDEDGIPYGGHSSRNPSLDKIKRQYILLPGHALALMQSSADGYGATAGFWFRASEKLTS
jgi:hypothetical protein